MVPLHPKRPRVMTRNWSAEPETRIIRNLKTRLTRYGQGAGAPVSNMIKNMRQQETFRDTANE